jgi:hypothetical protein
MVHNPKMTEMTLLDYFAAEAMVGLVGAARDAQPRDDALLGVAAEAYDVAEKMLLVRMERYHSQDTTADRAKAAK